MIDGFSSFVRTYVIRFGFQIFSPVGFSVSFSYSCHALFFSSLLSSLFALYTKFTIQYSTELTSLWLFADDRLSAVVVEVRVALVESRMNLKI